LAPAANVTVTDSLPSQTTFKSISAPFGWTCTTPAIGSNGTVSCTKTTMAPSESPATFTIVATVDCSVADGTSISDTATVSSSTTDADPTNNSSTATVTASNPPPSITCPANITMVDNVPGSCGASVDPGTPATSDNCGINSVVGVRSDSQALTDLYPVGTTTITWTATDNLGNTTSCPQTVTVTNPAPAVIITGPITPQEVNTPVNLTATFTDNAADTHTAVWTIDGLPQSGIVDETTHTVTATHTFTTLGVHAVSVTLTDDCGQVGTTDISILIYAFATAPANGSFVIGNGNAAVGSQVTFWGSQWAKQNSLSGGAAPSSFNGFANRTSSSPPNCGGSWTTDPGNSSNPPSTIPEYIGVFVTSSITKSSSTISGNIRQMVIVKTNPGYDDNPGHAGTGTVVAVICTSP